MLICVATCGHCASPPKLCSAITSCMLRSVDKCARISACSNLPTNSRTSIVEVGLRSVISSRPRFRGALTFQKGKIVVFKFSGRTQFGYDNNTGFSHLLFCSLQRSRIVLFDRVDIAILSKIFERVRRRTMLWLVENVHINFHSVFFTCNFNVK